MPDDAAAAPDDLAPRVKDYLEENPSSAWDEAVGSGNYSLRGSKSGSLDNHVSRVRQAAIAQLPCAYVAEASQIAATKTSLAVDDVVLGDGIGAERVIKIATYHCKQGSAASQQMQAATAAVIGEAAK